MTAPSRVSNIAAKFLGINTNYREEPPESVTRGESVVSDSTVETYVEEDPTSIQWVRDVLPTSGTAKRYFKELFPFLSWITRYNTQWLAGDLIAGLTVGAVVVPQGMAYALLAKLPAEYGLYTSFMGFLLYWAFATSKDITIGTVAVMSTLVGNIVIKVQDTHPDIPAEEIARTLAVVSGCIVTFIGLARIGWIVEFIPLTAITAFMTGSAISIGVGQIPAMMGIPGINTREAAYIVFINTLKNLGKSKLDAAMGLSALVMLYAIRTTFSVMTKNQPNRKKLWFFLSTLRIAFVMLLYILISYLANRNVKDAKKAKFRILGKIPRGFQHAGAPKMNARTISAFASELPATVIVLLIEHIAISKSFGRINNYTINPSQELVAIGFTNIFGPFLGAYPATGSFSRTAIKSKAGVRTPLAGVFTAIVVLLALYALTAVFFYIPMSSLAAIIIHAVGDLITPPSIVYQFWQVSPLEVPIFFAGVLVTLFTNIENGIYVTIAVSAAVLLFRVAKAKGRFLGRIKVASIPASSLPQDTGKTSITSDSERRLSGSIIRDVFVPLEHEQGNNPQIDAESPAPGIFIYRFSEGFNYPNSAHYLDYFTEYIFTHTRRTTLDTYGKLGDRPWNDPGPRRGQAVNLDDDRPVLRAIVLDFSAVNNVDVSSIQNLIDVRNQLDRYSSPQTVTWHIACVNNRWTKRALASAGFGYNKTSTAQGLWKSVITVADYDSSSTLVGDDKDTKGARVDDLEIGIMPSKGGTISTSIEKSRGGIAKSTKSATVLGVNRPFFYIDITSALESALANSGDDPFKTA
ncbi:sulfate permease 2 [Amylocarpus encephaloides]|uniref:Sulfate permease 2 n=1 Tax=Amylocarpus encephaloides TaxID=45428 RepID=A0A9P8C5C3_9HELO|nr:sulfate permease 2 [Amylocarpus encephaloides]